MADVEQGEAEAVTDEAEAKGEVLKDQFAAADAEAEPEAPPTVEELAESIGWTPKDRFKGNPDNWKPAAEFIKAGRNESRNLKAKLDRVEQTLDTVAKTTGAVVAEQIAKKHAQLEAQYAAAVERGDPDEAWKAANQIMRLQDTAQPAAAQPSQSTVEWAERNQWMKTDPVARARAIQVADLYAREGASAEQQTSAAEQIIRREFPHHFAGNERAAEVNGVRTRASGGAKRGTTAADMPKEAQKIADDLVERGLIPDREAYARNYFAQAAKGR